jgi:hypothetical protein
VSIDPLSFFILILICMSDLTLFIHSESVSTSSFSRFQFMDLGPCLFYIPLEFQPKMKNWIYHHYWIPKYTSVLSSSAILQGLPNAPRNLFPNY